MKQVDIRAAVEPFARVRTRALDSKTDLGNGTLLADGAATILAYILAKRGRKAIKDPEGEVASLGDDQITTIMDAVRDLMMEKGKAGSVSVIDGHLVEAGYRSGIKIGNIQYIPIRGRPGLHEMSNVQDKFHPDRPGMRMLRDAIILQFMGLPAMDIPTPSVDDIIILNEYRYRDKMLVPMRGGPGIAYMDEETIEPVETMLDIEIDLLARITAAKAKSMWENRELVDQEYGKLVTIIEPLVEAARAKGIPVAFTGVKVKESGQGHAWHYIDVRPMFEVLGNDLKPSTWSPWWDPRKQSLEKVFLSQMTVQARRKRILDQSAAEGARGRIDRVTLAAIRAFSPDPAETLRRMAKERKMTIQMGRKKNRSDPLNLTWRNGQIASSFSFTDDISWDHGTLIIKSTSIPESVLQTIPGRPLRTLIEHPFLNPDDVIRSISANKWGGEWTRFNIAVSWTTFNAETGEVAD